jgi:lauroyl/myristoyl acyltransferase
VDFLLLLPLALVALWITRARQQQRRIAILARYLHGHDIEKHIETLSQGYSRALGESDPTRGEQVWGVLRGTEDALSRQVSKLAERSGPANLNR